MLKRSEPPRHPHVASQHPHAAPCPIPCHAQAAQRPYGHLLFFFLLTLLTAATLFPLAAVHAADDEVARKVAIRHLEYLGDGSVRAFVSAVEIQGGVNYPITTLDRAAFQVFTSVDPNVPIRADSLWTFQTLAPAKKRAMVIAYHDTNDIPTRSATEIRKAIAEVLPGTRSDFLSILATGGGRVEELASISPSQSENIKAIQRTILDSNSLGSDPGTTESLCAAASKFEGWSAHGFTEADQKILVGVFSMGDPAVVAPSHTDECWKRLEALGVTTYIISYSPGTSLKAPFVFQPERTRGGFLHQVRSSLDVFPALSNIMSNVNDEYVFELKLPDFEFPVNDVGLEVQIGYHGHVFRSAQKTLNLPPRFVPSTVETDDGTKRFEYEKLALIVALVSVVVSLIILAVRAFKKQKNSRTCSTCAQRVERNFSDCPFRKSDCIARLVVVSGDGVGINYPLRIGENLLGRGLNVSLHLPRGRGIKRRHATITIKEQKALYQPHAAAGIDRINGWPVLEPRLLATGSIIRIGALQLRFEAKPET